MKAVLLTDLHAGVRNNSLVFMEHQIRFFEQCFFPYCIKNNLKKLIIGGDIFDRRKDTHNFVVHEWNRRVFQKWDELFEETHILIGNHDTYFKNTNTPNTPEEFLKNYKSFKFYSSPQELNLFWMKTLILPWICEENEAQTNALVDSSMADLVIGHLEIKGCPMFRGIENLDMGFEQPAFSKFKKVLSGHFHIRSLQRNIEYLGAPYSTTWAEAQDVRGFHVIDTDTLALEFIENPFNPFVHIDYENNSLDSVPEVREKIVRILVKKKDSEADFLEFLEKIEEQNPSEVNVQEQAAVSTLEGKVDENLDLFSLMDLYVDTLQCESPKQDLKLILRELYNEALHLHDISE